MKFKVYFDTDNGVKEHDIIANNEEEARKKAYEIIRQKRNYSDVVEVKKTKDAAEEVKDSNKSNKVVVKYYGEIKAAKSPSDLTRIWNKIATVKGLDGEEKNILRGLINLRQSELKTKDAEMYRQPGTNITSATVNSILYNILEDARRSDKKSEIKKSLVNAKAILKKFPNGGDENTVSFSTIKTKLAYAENKFKTMDAGWENVVTIKSMRFDYAKESYPDKTLDIAKRNGWLKGDSILVPAGQKAKVNGHMVVFEKGKLDLDYFDDSAFKVMDSKQVILRRAMDSLENMEKILVKDEAYTLSDISKIKRAYQDEVKSSRGRNKGEGALLSVAKKLGYNAALKGSTVELSDEKGKWLLVVSSDKKDVYSEREANLRFL